MKRLYLKRWIALAAVDYIAVDVPDDFDLDEDDPEYIGTNIVSEEREILDSTDRGQWEIWEEP